MRAHLRYLRYVLLHKLYVLRAGIIINGYSIPWLWRLLMHDRSKFSRAEWTPYVCMFYGPPPEVQARREVDEHEATYHNDESRTLYHEARDDMIAQRTAEIKRDRQRRFNEAWLHHIHANPHHWQHWLLQQDDGKLIVLEPTNAALNEMIADWIGAGNKILSRPSLAACVGETIVWYCHGASQRMQLRQNARQHIEHVLLELAYRFKLDRMVGMISTQRAQRRSLVVSAGD